MDEINQNSASRNLFQRHRQKSEGVGDVFSKGSDKNQTSRNILIHTPGTVRKWNLPQIYDKYKERLRLYKRWPCSTYILNRVN